MSIKDGSYLKWPPKMWGDPTTRNPNIYYHFHHDFGHTTKNCWNLCDEIKELIRRGYLKQYIQRDGRELGDLQADQRRNAPESSRRNSSVRELEHEARNPPKRPRIEEPIYFTEDGARGIQYPHDDALVVKLVINDFKVKKILVYLGSSTYILFLEAFEKLQLQQSDMQPANSPLVGFSGKVVRPLGRIMVPVAAGTWPNLARSSTPSL
ncbi:PREDICTED: uncharacterized protein LOC104608795 [Nelumbo nucifera]|uniref:Uncharacterized protein LOC104608795 n=1 Tax=Nelumbo nucifera TaxID=4432 RepID=A0A1U8AYD6_NELNU|nr:PREDICTED: uncharacterized protein LOC104608795 [Nelumbo nucifera]